LEAIIQLGWTSEWYKCWLAQLFYTAEVDGTGERGCPRKTEWDGVNEDVKIFICRDA